MRPPPQDCNNPVAGVLDSAWYGSNMKQHPVYGSGMHEVVPVFDWGMFVY